MSVQSSSISTDDLSQTGSGINSANKNTQLSMPTKNVAHTSTKGVGWVPMSGSKTFQNSSSLDPAFVHLANRTIEANSNNVIAATQASINTTKPTATQSSHSNSPKIRFLLPVALLAFSHYF